MSIKLCVRTVLIGLLIMISLTNCNGISTATPTATLVTPTETAPFIKQPEPHEPHIVVSFSGLDESSIGYVYFRTTSGRVVLRGSRPENADTKVVLSDRQGD